MSEDRRKRLARYVENHPNAEAIEIIASPDTNVGPEDWEFIEDVIQSIRDGQDEFGISPSGSSYKKEITEPVLPEWPCAKPGCRREAVNPHQDSLCPKHHPGSTTQLEAERMQERLDEDDGDQKNGHDLLTEAQAVAGEEPDEPELSSAGAVDDALEDAIARDQRDGERADGDVRKWLSETIDLTAIDEYTVTMLSDVTWTPSIKMLGI